MLALIMVKKSWRFENHKKGLFYISSINDVSRSKFQYVEHLWKSCEYGTLTFKHCALIKVTTEKYVGSLYIVRTPTPHPIPLGVSHFSERVYGSDLCQIVILGGNWHFKWGSFFSSGTWNFKTLCIRKKEWESQTKKWFQM